jgi:hypothetical protein
LEHKKEENKEYYDRNKRTKEAGIKKGDIVICKQKKNNKLTSKFDPEHYTVEQRKHNTIIAKASHFKKVVMEESEKGAGFDIQTKFCVKFPTPGIQVLVKSIVPRGN